MKAGDLKDHIALQQTSWIPLSPKKYLDPFTVDIDRQRIEAYYAAHGYFFAHVTKADIIKRGDGKSVDVDLAVDEGLPTKLDQVQIQGLESLDPKQRAKFEKSMARVFKHGDVFVHQKYLDHKELVENRMQQLGYAWAVVTGEVAIDRDKRLADLTIKVAPGPRATFGHVYITGYNTISPKLILERAQIEEGTRFNPQVIENARGRIYNTGVFGSVKIEYDHDPSDPTRADVVVTVHEGQFRELRLGGGFDFETTRYDIHLSGEYTRHNFLGGLRTLKLTLEPGWVLLVNPQSIGAPGTGPSNGPSLKAQAEFTQPDIFPKTELRWTVGYDVGIDYAYQYHGPRTTLGLQRSIWNERIHLGLSYNFNFLLFFNTVQAFSSDPHLASALYGYTDPYRVGWFQEDFTLDLRDKPLDPHLGVYLGTSVEEGGEYAGGSFEYEKIMPDFRGYLPFGKRIVLAGRFQFGQIFDQGSDGSPITRRFFEGGPNSHRGFNYDRMSVQIPLGYGGVSLPIGGDQMVLISGELRVDVYKLAGNWLGFTTFIDAGDVAAPRTAPGTSLTPVLSPKPNDPGGSCQNGQTPRISTNVDWAKLHTAVGAGLRYHTIIGTIRADVGVRVNRTTACEADGTPNPDPGSRVAFHISIGESF